MTWRTFSAFMETALYGPHGYYRRSRSPFGRAGDFYTNAHVSSLFGDLWASFALETAPCSPDEPFRLVELGCGDGRFAEDCCRRLLAQRPEGLILYGGVDLSDISRRRTTDRLERLARETGGRLRFAFAGSPAELIAREPLLRGSFTFGNEVLDALPCEVIRASGDGVELLWVEDRQRPQAHGGGSILWHTEWRQTDASAESVSTLYVERYVSPVIREWGVPVVTESPVALRAFMADLTAAIAPCALAFVDYGGHSQDLMGPDRPNGSLRAYREHRLVDPFCLGQGECDITYDVNFDAVTDILHELGFREICVKRQGAFLVSLPRFAEFAGARLQMDAKAALAIQQIVMPGAMGDRFQVCVAKRG